MRYCPAASVTTVRVFSISAGLEASTLTPGKTAPEPSLTAPVIEACALASREVINIATKTIAADNVTRRMVRLLIQ